MKNINIRSIFKGLVGKHIILYINNRKEDCYLLEVLDAANFIKIRNVIFWSEDYSQNGKWITVDSFVRIDNITEIKENCLPYNKDFDLRQKIDDSLKK